MPGDLAPALAVPTVAGTPWNLHAGAADRFQLIAVFRGAFCRFCREWIEALDRATPEFVARGIDVVAISMDDAAAARDLHSLLGLGSLTLCHGLDEDTARRWQLYLSRRKLPGGEQMILHPEPAVFMITPDRRVYVVMQQSVSFGRPDIASMLAGIDVLASAGFPVRGNA